MDEHLHRYYTEEEKFLKEFSGPAAVAAELLHGDWWPNRDCNDNVRRNHKYFFSTGQVQNLVFDGAAVYHDANGFSSLQIILRSSDRVVNVRVRQSGSDLVAEKIVDRPTSAG